MVADGRDLGGPRTGAQRHRRPRRGGRVYETWHDDTTVDWGELLVWDPPHRFTMSWTCTPAPTEVELTFSALGPSLTRVAVEHRGWEALSRGPAPRRLRRCPVATPRAFATGWARILAALAARRSGRTRMKYVVTYELAEGAQALAMEHYPAHRARLDRVPRAR